MMSGMIVSVLRYHDISVNNYKGRASPASPWFYGQWTG